MQLNPKDKLFGQPILKIRTVVRAAMKVQLWGDDKSELENKVAKLLGKSAAVSKKVIADLIHEGYLVLKREKDDGSFYYKLVETDKGRRFGVASANPPISREKADLMLAELIEKAKMINASTKYIYRVESVKVFGSYLSDKATLGDLDVAVKVIQKLEGEVFSQANFKRIETAKKEGRVFRSFTDEISWPYKEVMLKLKTRKKGLSLHDESDDEVVNLTKTKTVYTYSVGV